MHRILCFIIAALCVLTLSAQEVALPDTTATDSLAGWPTSSSDVVAAGACEEPQDTLPEYIQQSLFRSWRRTNPLRSPRRFEHYRPESQTLVDSLMQVVVALPRDDKSMQYLYDMRLPLISAGDVPVAPVTSVGDDVMLQDSLSLLPESFVSDPALLFNLQNAYERQRHQVRYNYASVDPRRFRFARRTFDVPTANSHVIDTESSLQNTRIVDDLELDFSNASLEDFGQQLVIKADKWHWKGDHTLQMQQTSLSDNWYKGGDDNMSVSGEQKLSISRYDEHQKTTFEMILDLKLSAFYTTSDTVHQYKVSDNLFTWDIKYGYKAWKKWYYSTQLYAKTPIFDYYTANSKVTKSTFLSPLEVNLSLGMDYKYTSPKKAFTYSLLLAPFSYNMKYVRDERVNETTYGLDEGDKFKHEFGSTLTNKFDWKMGPNATWSSRLYCFTSYRNVLFEFENTFTFAISRYFSARIYAYPRFDDSRDSKIEMKEMLTFGFNYIW